jgi:hypothetical protein
MNKMMVKDEALRELLERIEVKYGDLDNTRGCAISTDKGYEWLSIANIVELIEEVDREFDSGNNWGY